MRIKTLLGPFWGHDLGQPVPVPEVDFCEAWEEA